MRVILVLIVLMLAACGSAAPTSQAALPAAQIELETTPEPAVGNATLLITVKRENAPLADAPVSVRGNMTHPGMAPVLGDGKTDANGKLALPFKWSMGGDWIVTVTVTLPDGSQVSQDFNMTVKP